MGRPSEIEVGVGRPTREVPGGRAVSSWGTGCVVPGMARFTSEPGDIESSGVVLSGAKGTCWVI